MSTAQGGNEHQEDERRHARPEKGHNTRGETENADNDERTHPIAPLEHAEGGDRNGIHTSRHIQPRRQLQ
jgi:hypothetical protein